jgi:hypothetical protein
MKKFFQQILPPLAVAGILGLTGYLRQLSNEQAKTNERLVRIETRLGITLAEK